MGAIDNQSFDNQIETLFLGYFGRAADPFSFNQVSQEYTADAAANESVDQILSNIAASLAATPEALLLYPFLQTPQNVVNTGSTLLTQQLTSLVDNIYHNLFDISPAAGDTGVAYWVNQLETGKVTVPDLMLDIANGATGAGLITLDDKISAGVFFTTQTVNAGLGTSLPLSPAFLAAATIANMDVTTDPSTVSVSEAATLAFIASQQVITGHTYGPLTIGTDTLPGASGPPATGFDTFNAPLVPPAGGQTTQQATLTNFDNLVDIAGPGGAHSVLNADFDGSATASGLNIVNIPTWNIQNIDREHLHFGSSTIYNPSGITESSQTVFLTGDGPSGTNHILGLTTLNYNANSGGDSLIIGDNAEPVEAGANGAVANGFAITVSNAVGNGFNGVDVDISAADFTPAPSTINVTANAVGGFPEFNGSFVVPPPIVEGDDTDTYNPNWIGYGEDAYAISAGASAGPVTANTPSTERSASPTGSSPRKTRLELET
jgi:hypothetical protein